MEDIIKLIKEGQVSIEEVLEGEDFIGQNIYENILEDDKVKFELEFCSGLDEDINNFMIELFNSGYIKLEVLDEVSPLLRVEGYISYSRKDEFFEFLKSQTNEYEDGCIIIYLENEDKRYQFYEGVKFGEFEGSITKGWDSPKFIYNENGKREQVIISVDEYNYYENLEMDFDNLQDEYDSLQEKLEEAEKEIKELKIALISKSLNQTSKKDGIGS